MSDTRAELLARVCAEQRDRWRAGHRVLVEEFLARYPALEADEAGLVDLIVGEIQLRQRLGETPTLDEYLRRFPRYHAHLSGCFVLPARHSPKTMAPGNSPTQFPPAPGARPSPSISDVAILASMPPSSDGGSTGDTGTDGVRRTQTMEGGSNPFESTGLREALGDAVQDGGLAVTLEGAVHAAPPAPRRFPNPPGYVILAELGKGGMGVVYKAWETRLRREVALKVALARPQGGTGATELGRFRKEAEAMARLHHPNIVQVYHVGEHEGVPYFALEYVEGQSLDQKLRLASQTAPEAARIVQTLALAAEHAHSMGVVHRDLKPANVLISKSGAIKLTDFGLAKRLDEVSTTKTGELMGTPCYMAPEQAAGHARAIGPACDVYALGAILYECLTGRPPFKEATTPLTILAVLHSDPVPPRQVQPAVPRDLETICLKCLEKDPKKRYASAATLADDLDRFLDNRTIMARRSTMPERAWKWARRRPAIAALTALSLVTLLLGSTSVLFYLERKAAEERRDRERVAAELEKLKKAEAERGQVLALLAQGEGHLTLKDWPAAFRVAETAGARINAGPEGLEDLRDQAAYLRDRAAKELTRADAQRKADDKRREAAAEFTKFKKLYDDALFLTSPSNGLPQDVNVARAGEKAREALEVFTDGAGTDGPARAAKSVMFRPLFRFLEKSRDQVETDVYELLLVLAEAEARSAPAGRPIERNERLDRAVRLLDRAHALRFQTVAWHERRADYLDRLGEKQQAEQARKEADRVRAQLEQGPGSQRERVVDLFLLGSAAYQQGQLLQAVLVLEQAVRLRPDHLWARHLLALCYLRLGEPARAEAHLSVCLGQRPGFVWFHLDRAQAHGQLADLARHAQPPQPGQAQYHVDRANEDYEKAAQLAAGDDTARYVLHHNRGLLWFQQGAPVRAADGKLVQAADDPKLKQAADELKRAIQCKSGPQRYRSHEALAEVYRERNLLPEARVEIEKAIALQRDQPDLYRRHARVRLDQGKATEAVAALEKAVERRKALLKKPASATQLAGHLVALPDDLANLGLALQTAGQYARAVDAFEEGLLLADQLSRLPGAQLLELPDARLGWGFCLFRCGEQQSNPEKKKGLYEAAITAYSYALGASRLRALPHAYVGRAAARMARGRPEDLAGAVQDYTVALALSTRGSDRPAWLAQCGWLYLDALGAPQLALADFEKVLALKANDGDGLAGRALARARLGRDRNAAAEDARQAFLLARKMAPAGVKSKEAARLFANAARAYARLGDAGGAVDALTEALKRLPDAQQRGFWHDAVRRNPADFDPVRNDPRFHDLDDRYGR